MKGRKKVIAICCLFLAGLLGLCGCSSPSSDSAKDRISDELVYESSMELEYAKQFSVDYYKDGYRLLATSDGTKILVIPEGKEAPKDLEKGIIVMQQPVQNLYLVSSSVMDIFDHLDALDSIRFSSQKEEDWYIEGAKKAMARGDISYAGKYSKPDYEYLISSWTLISITTAKLPFTIPHDYCILSLAFTIFCNCSEPSHLLSIIKMDFAIHFAACYNRIAASQPDSVKFSSHQLQLSYRNQ